MCVLIMGRIFDSSSTIQTFSRDSIRFDSIRFDSIRFDSIRFDSIRFDSIRFRLGLIRSGQKVSKKIDAYGTTGRCRRRVTARHLDTVQNSNLKPLIIRIRFDSIRFDSIRFDSIRFDSIRFDSIRFDSIRFDSIRFVFEISRIFESNIDSNEIQDSSHP